MKKMLQMLYWASLYAFRLSKNWKLLCLLVVIIYVLIWLWPPPMFHHHYCKDFLPSFFPIYRSFARMQDSKGTVGFSEERLNMIVLIVTKDKRALTFEYVYSIESSSWPFWHATLMLGSPFEATVSGERNTLLIIKNGKSFRFPIEEGMFVVLCREGTQNNSGGNKCILRIFANIYDGDKKLALEQLADELDAALLH